MNLITLENCIKRKYAILNSTHLRAITAYLQSSFDVNDLNDPEHIDAFLDDKLSQSDVLPLIVSYKIKGAQPRNEALVEFHCRIRVSSDEFVKTVFTTAPFSETDPSYDELVDIIKSSRGDSLFSCIHKLNDSSRFNVYDQ